MPQYHATITVKLRPAILDVQGKTVEHALHTLGFESVHHVRIGKHITLTLEAPDESSALAQCQEMCQQLLANPVIENYAVTIEVAKQ